MAEGDRATEPLRWQHVLTVVFCFILLANQHPIDAKLVRHTNRGKVRGKKIELPHLKKVVDAFLGIPFAKPPVGNLRFRHPQPMDPWTGQLNASKMPNSCWQPMDTMFGNFTGATMWNANTKLSEDCLYLNVYVPRKQPRLHKSPVLVWIYGGGFYSGTSTLDVYNLEVISAMHDIVVVSLQYRVGPFGFATLNIPEAPGNAGLFDQLMALEWVQENIHHFGGDPRNVTLMGESAGSVSVTMHLLSPLSRNKFKGAIMQSGAANAAWGTVSQEQGKARTVSLATTYAGCPDSNNPRKILKCLLSIDADVLSDNQWVTEGIMQFPFVPVIDGSFLTEEPEISLRNKNFKKCPVLLGSNKNEGSFFIIYELAQSLNLKSITMKREKYLSSMNRLFYFWPQYPHEITPLGLEAIIFQYTNWLDPDDELANVEALDRAVADYHFVCQVNRFADAYAMAGQNTYYYYFTQRYKINPWPEWMGVLHADEITFTFGEPFKQKYLKNFTAEEKELSRQMMQYWINFVKSG